MTTVNAPVDLPAPAAAVPNSDVGEPPAEVTVPTEPAAVTPPKLPANSPLVRFHLLRFLRSLVSARSATRSAMVLHMVAQLSVPPMYVGAVINIKRTILALISTIKSLTTLPDTFTVVDPPHLTAASSAFGIFFQTALDALPLEVMPRNPPEEVRDNIDGSSPDYTFMQVTPPPARGAPQTQPAGSPDPAAFPALLPSVVDRFAAMDPAVQAWFARASPEDLPQVKDSAPRDDDTIASYDNSMGASLAASPALAIPSGVRPAPSSIGVFPSPHALQRQEPAYAPNAGHPGSAAPAFDLAKTSEQYHATYTYAAAMASLSAAAESSRWMSLPSDYNERAYYRECHNDMFCNTLVTQVESLRLTPRHSSAEPLQRGIVPGLGTCHQLCLF